MRQVLFQIPIPFTSWEIPIFGYGFMLFVAFVIGGMLSRHLAKREGMDPDEVIDIALWVFLSGILGARSLFFLQHPDEFSFGKFFQFWKGGLVFYGSLIGAAPVFFWLTRRKNLPVLGLLDVIAAPIALGMGIGRIGCLLNGCCWGKPTDAVCAMSFPAQSIPWHAHLQGGLISESATASLAVHPTQVYLSLAGFLLAACTFCYFPFRRRDGEVMAVLLIGYAITRFVIEFFRADVPLEFTQLTISQNISVLILIAGVGGWSWLRFRRVVSD